MPKLIKWTKLTVPAYLMCFVAMHVLTLFVCPHIAAAFRQHTLILCAIFVVALPVTLNILREMRKGHAGHAFLSSCLALVLHFLIFGAAVYPNLVFSTPNHANDMNIYNSASTEKSLSFLFFVAIIGVPVVLTYTITLYYFFRGKVLLTEESY